MSPQSSQLELSVSIASASFSATGDTQIVLDAYADFKELLRSGVPTVASGDQICEEPTTENRAQPREQEHPAATEVKAPTSLPLKPYLARLRLRGNKHKAAALLAWSAESGEKAELTASEIEQLWRRSPFKVPKNVPRDVRAAEAEGWLDSAGKENSPSTTYRINGFGEGIVAGWVTPSES